MLLCYIIYMAHSFKCIFHQRANSHRIHINHIKMRISLCARLPASLGASGYFSYILLSGEPQKNTQKEF